MPVSRASVGLSVSLVVPSYQGNENLHRLFRALELQVVKCSWEVIVVLDGSTDSSAQVCSDFATKLPLKTVARQVNLGRSRTLNEGFALASMQVLVRCDDDLEPDPFFVQRFSDSFTQNPNQGVIGLYKNQFQPGRYAEKYGMPVDARFREAAFSCSAEERWQYWAGNCGVSREVFDRVGDYDNKFQDYGWEDIDWGYRLAHQGVPINIPIEFSVLHHLAAVNAKKRCERARWSGRAAMKFHAKHEISRQLPTELRFWNRLVSLLTPIAGKQLGQIVDLLLYFLPAKLAGKIVDLAVEASFNRGYIEAKRNS